MFGIEKVKDEYEALLRQLSDPGLISNWEKFEELSKKKKRLEKIIAKDDESKELKNKIEENKQIIKAHEDQDLISLAEGELPQLQEKQISLEKELENLLKERDGDDAEEPGAVIIEIRAGTGGEEAALFAADLYKMYARYAANQNWKQKVLDSKPTELGGIKEITFEVSSPDVWQKIKYEGGVHRIQRIPVTEKSGRIHTSTASVAILPKSSKTQAEIRPEDLKVDHYRASGPGGQNVNKRETAVRITHLPSGLVVTSQTERNQAQNKENALAILGARLFEKREIENLEKLGEKRRAQIKLAKRAEKIRTYNFPQDRVTDHRIKKSWHGLESIMAGKLDLIVSDLQAEIKEE